MGSDRFSLTAFNFNRFQDGNGSIQEEVVFHREHSTFAIMKLMGVINPLPTTEHENEAHCFKEQNQQQKHDSEFYNFMLQEFNFGPALQLQPKHPSQETKELNNQGVSSSQLVGHNKQVPPSSLASLELLRNYRNRFKRLRGENINSTEISVSPPQKLSTEEIIRAAAARYIQHPAQWDNNFCVPMHPYGFGLGGLSEEENRDVELAHFLLAVADRVGCQQFERASVLLFHSPWNSSDGGNSLQRVIFHFAKALRERINKEIGGRMTLKGCEKNKEREMIQNLELDTNMAITCHQKIPFNQVMQFAGVQAIVEHVASQTKIHVIDLIIGCGVMCTALMQALAERKERPVELLKITAIGLKGKIELEETGKRLVSFAESLNLPFLYKVVFVTDIIDINEDQFEIDDDEAVAIYSPYILRTMVSSSDSLDNLMRVIRKIRPCIMIVLELEANHNSPSFVNRFIEAFFFFSAYFDCVETCLNEDYECRMKIEAILSEGIRNIVAMEEGERKVRNVKIDVWRRFFARYRMVETGFSESSLYQAYLVVKKFACGNFCTLDQNGKCLIIGWKGSPIHSISAWKFL
ncbi:DELLA protein RGL1-like [Gastrolobium bilobum]|uniref:DELLA protein RGL1-like n=1 Tax=Gastrolobium bilobum TaxID=150636 RepID=UPI002AB01FB7|nr:DELLA protein RGL1-like [Gastrolobium bilobum]